MRTYDRNDYEKLRNIRGDLYVSFEIEFPKHITSEQKERIASILGHSG